MKTKWKSKVPTNEGWYWIKYKGKHGTVICPADVSWFKDQFFVRTARNDTLMATNEKFFGKYYFGSKIKLPDA